MSAAAMVVLLALVLLALLAKSRARDKLLVLLGIALGAQLASLAAGAMVRQGSSNVIGYLITLVS